MQVVGALLVGATGGIHLWLWFDFFHTVHIVGALFLVNAAAAALLAVALVVSEHPFVLLAGIGFAAATLAFFLVSATAGLFGYVESLRGSWQEAAGGVEVAAIIALTAPFASSISGMRPSRAGEPRR